MIPQNKSPSNSITFNLIDEEAEGLMDTQEVEREIKDTAVLVHNLHRRKFLPFQTLSMRWSTLSFSDVKLCTGFHSRERHGQPGRVAG
ncbi:hypothetical protein NC652_035735 [Populus alba x Populus x berolinensis]|nr:hypothetical protein NC652_035735 [Populus alba x Populus x berolinensis]